MSQIDFSNKTDDCVRKAGLTISILLDKLEKFYGKREPCQ